MNKKQFPYLPFFIPLISSFPALALLVNNLGQVALWTVQRSLFVSIVIGSVIFILKWFWLKDWKKASLWTSLTLVLFSSYGHVYIVVEDYHLAGMNIGRHRYLLIIWAFLFGLGSRIILQKLKEVSRIFPTLNIVAFTLVMVQLVQIGVYQVKFEESFRQALASSETAILSPSGSGNDPDVYVIVLDMYGREDALTEYYDYDNSEFTSRLEDLGFYVAGCSRANYSRTVLALSSQLNLEYVDEILNDVNREAASTLMKHSTVQKAFEDIGYTTIAFDTGIDWANLDEADIFYYDQPEDRIILSIEPFEILFVESTILSPFLDYYISRIPYLTPEIYTPITMKALRTEMVLDHLRVLPSRKGPKFVFAHIMVPHPPHVFNIDGSINYQPDLVADKVGLSAQLDYLNPQILEIVERIIRNSHPEPIVILEGDHGFGNFQRTSILNAFFLPDEGEEGLYPHISLVNTFRVVFNQYFGGDYEVLEDISYKHDEEDRFSYHLHEEWNPDCIRVSD
jgi:hypothetical protein